MSRFHPPASSSSEKHKPRPRRRVFYVDDELDGFDDDDFNLGFLGGDRFDDFPSMLCAGDQQCSTTALDKVTNDSLCHHDAMPEACTPQDLKNVMYDPDNGSSQRRFSLNRLYARPSPERHSFAKAILDSTEQLEQASQRIRSELWHSELIELAVEAERAAANGDESFSAKASTYGDEATVKLVNSTHGNAMNHSSHHQPRPSRIRRHSSLEGMRTELPSPLIPDRRRRKLPVTALRDISEVLPQWRELHVHVRAHLSQRDVAGESLCFSEASAVDQPERQDPVVPKSFNNCTTSYVTSQSLTFLEEIADYSMTKLTAAATARPDACAGANALLGQVVSHDAISNKSSDSRSGLFGDTLSAHQSPGEISPKPFKVHTLQGLEDHARMLVTTPQKAAESRLEAQQKLAMPTLVMPVIKDDDDDNSNNNVTTGNSLAGAVSPFKITRWPSSQRLRDQSMQFMQSSLETDPEDEQQRQQKQHISGLIPWNGRSDVCEEKKDDFSIHSHCSGSPNMFTPITPVSPVALFDDEGDDDEDDNDDDDDGALADDEDGESRSDKDGIAPSLSATTQIQELILTPRILQQSTSQDLLDFKTPAKLRVIKGTKATPVSEQTDARYGRGMITPNTRIMAVEPSSILASDNWGDGEKPTMSFIPQEQAQFLALPSMKINPPQVQRQPESEKSENELANASPSFPPQKRTDRFGTRLLLKQSSNDQRSTAAGDGYNSISQAALLENVKERTGGRHWRSSSWGPSMSKALELAIPSPQSNDCSRAVSHKSGSKLFTAPPSQLECDPKVFAMETENAQPQRLDDQGYESSELDGAEWQGDNANERSFMFIENMEKTLSQHNGCESDMDRTQSSVSSIVEPSQVRCDWETIHQAASWGGNLATEVVGLNRQTMSQNDPGSGRNTPSQQTEDGTQLVNISNSSNQSRNEQGRATVVEKLSSLIQKTSAFPSPTRILARSGPNVRQSLYFSDAYNREFLDNYFYVSKADKSAERKRNNTKAMQEDQFWVDSCVEGDYCKDGFGGICGFTSFLTNRAPPDESLPTIRETTLSFGRDSAPLSGDSGWLDRLDLSSASRSLRNFGSMMSEVSEKPMKRTLFQPPGLKMTQDIESNLDDHHPMAFSAYHSRCISDKQFEAMYGMSRRQFVLLSKTTIQDDSSQKNVTKPKPIIRDNTASTSEVTEDSSLSGEALSVTME